MSEYRRQSAFLKRLLEYDDSAESRALADRLAAAERNERSLVNACRTVAAIAVLGLFGFGYSAVLLPQFFDHSSHFLIRLCSAIALGSTLCLFVFFGVWFWYRAGANKVREECRQAVSRVLESRLRPEVCRTEPVIGHAPYLSIVTTTAAKTSSPDSPPLRKAS